MMSSELETKTQKLKKIFQTMERVLVAFSGGVDSTLLLKVARDTLGDKNVLAVTALSPLYPERELAAVKRLVETLGVRHRLIESNELEIPGFSKNPSNRCYYCKEKLQRITGLPKKKRSLLSSKVPPWMTTKTIDLGGWRFRSWGSEAPSKKHCSQK
jgi:uncharacterized protein